MATSLFDTWIIETPEEIRALEEALREAEARGPLKPRIDVSELFTKGYMFIELDDDWDLLTPTDKTEKKS